MTVTTAGPGTLRDEIRAVLDSPAAGPAWRALAEPGPWGENDPRPMYRLLGTHRLLAPAWPRAFGGRGISLPGAAVAVREMIAAGVPDTLHTLSVQICGSFLLRAGSPAQRAALLPALAAGQRYCTVLYTEPAAGSDLAALAAEAVPAGDGRWRITGHKLFSVRTRLADTGLVAARTAPQAGPYRGITLFLVPLGAPGVTVSRLGSLADEAFADVRLDDVLVGTEAVVGTAGEAWPLITEALALERTGVDHAAKAAAWLSAAVGALDADAAAERAGWLPQAGRLRTRTRAAEAMAVRCVADLDRGDVSPVHAAAAKLWCSETAREVSGWAVAALGDAGLWRAGDPGAVAGGRLEAAYREAPGLVISAGTSEMMRELVAGGGLTAALAAGRPDGEPGEAVLDTLRAAVRAVAWAGTPDPASWAGLAGLGLFRFVVPRAAGGLDLGHAALAAACGELGACGYDGGVLDTLTVAAALGGAAGQERLLAPVLDGAAKGALVMDNRPGRPVTDPGPDGVLLIVSGYDDAATLDIVPAGVPGVTRQARLAMTGSLATVALAPEVTRRPLGYRAGQVPALLAGDLLCRAAWLIGAGTACLRDTEEHAGSRRQFGRALLDNQVIAHRLAGLAVTGHALRTLLDAETGGIVSLPACAGLLAEAGRFARSAADAGLHLRGAAGMVAGSVAERAWRAVTLGIAGGPAPAVLDRLAARGGERP
jgi:alkylation response protein AidB-like acyl-CoA dehydrogenase